MNRRKRCLQKYELFTNRNLIIAMLTGLFMLCSTNWSCSPKTQRKGEAVSMEWNQFLKSVTDQRQRELLNQFRQTLSRNDNVLVQEFDDHYEITVTHPSSENFTGGAEGYRLDKVSGKIEMIWHEHPMPFSVKKEKITNIDEK